MNPVDCVFCQIIAKKVPSRVVYEDEHGIVFLDISGDVAGHLILAPKKHTENLLDTDVDMLQKMQIAISQVNEHLIKNCGYDGVNILSASGKAAGQSVNHLHFHIIPRREKDGIEAWPVLQERKEVTSEELFEKLKV